MAESAIYKSQYVSDLAIYTSQDVGLARSRCLTLQFMNRKCAIVTAGSYSVKNLAGKSAGRSFLFSTMEDHLACGLSSATSKAI